MKHARPSKPFPPRRMTAEERREFVLAWCAGRVVTSFEVPGHLLPAVFLPIIMLSGSFTEADLARVAFVWADTARDRHAGAINGFPMFASLRLMARADWVELRPAIEAELKRQKSLRP